ncbi:MAG: hypothetical protein WC506_05595 [Candidatus Micrarchaeia archaeon]
MVQAQRAIPDAGIGKVQALPYSMWNELKSLKNRDAALDFIMAHREVENLFIRELGAGAADRIINKQKFKDNADRDFADEVFKSCILRAAGSAKADWVPWWVGPQGYSCWNFSKDGRIAIPANGQTYKFPVPYGLELDSKTFMNMCVCGQELANAMDPEGEKRIFRADFTLENSNGKIIPWLTDFGESHLTFVLATHLHDARGINEDLAARYLAAMKLPEKPARTWLVTQGAKTMHDMPYEIEGIRMELEALGHSPIVCTLQGFVEKLEAGEKLEEGQDIVLRFFRHAESSLIQKIKELTSNAQVFIDSLDFIPRLQKFNVNRMISLNREELEFWVSIPKSIYMNISGDSDDSTTAIAGWAKASGIEEIVLKPGNARMQPNAFFYRLDNPHHLEEMARSIRRMRTHGITIATAEEMVGNGAVDGKKAELRLWIFKE